MAGYSVLRHELEKTCVLLQRHIPEAEIEIMAREWSETLRHIPDALLVAAFRKHRERSRFLPAEADLRLLAAELTPSTLILESKPVTPEAQQRFERFAGLVAAAMRGEHEARTFFAQKTPKDEKQQIWNRSGGRMYE